MAEYKARPVILDTDIGSDIDDTWALALIMRSPELSLKAITTVTHDTEYRAKLCAKLLRTGGHRDVPLGLGPVTCRLEKNCCQQEWLGDYSLDDYKAPVVHDAAGLIIETVRRSTEPVVLLGIGPFSNIAEVVRRAPEVIGKIDFIGLGGSVYMQYFGKPGHCREYNILMDVPAAATVLGAKWHSILLSPLDTCGNILIRGVRYQRLKNSENPLAKAVIANYLQWRKFRVQYFPGDPDYEPEAASSLIADTAAVALCVDPGFAEIRSVPLSVSNSGETLVDENAGYPVPCALNWHNVEKFYDFVTERLLDAAAKSRDMPFGRSKKSAFGKFSVVTFG